MPLPATGHQGGVRAAFFMGARQGVLTGVCALLLTGTVRAAQGPVPVPDGPARPAVTAASGTAAAVTAHEDPTWSALLHLRAGRPQIDDPAFLLSAGAFSPRAELDALRAALRGPDAQATACRFPARTLWLQSRGEATDVDTGACPDWVEFERRAASSAGASAKRPGLPTTMLSTSRRGRFQVPVSV